MNDAHYHLIINHFPVIGTFFGLAIVLAGILTEKKEIKIVAFFIFVFTAILALLSLETGEGAADLVSKLPNVSNEKIGSHAEKAEILTYFLCFLGFLSAINLYLYFKKYSPKKWILVAILILAIVSIFLAAQTGISGGEIRHNEITNQIESNTH